MGYDSGMMNGSPNLKMGGQQQPQQFSPFAGAGGMPMNGQANMKMGGQAPPQQTSPFVEAFRQMLQQTPGVQQVSGAPQTSPTQPAQMSAPPPMPMQNGQVAQIIPQAQALGATIQPQASPGAMMMSPQQLQAQTQSLIGRAGQSAPMPTFGAQTPGYFGNQGNMQGLLRNAG